MFKTAIDEKYLDENPFEKVQEFRLPSKGMDNHFSKDDLTKISVVSLDDWETKTGKNRTIPLDKRAQEILTLVKGMHEKYVFVGDNGKATRAVVKQ